MVASTTPVQLQQCLCDGETIRVLRSLPLKTYNNVSQVTASVTVAENRDLNGGEAVR